jgi:hypothetical protein
VSRLEHAAEVAGLAADLGLAGAANTVEAILRHCRTRIDRWVAEAGGVASIAALEALMTQRLQMVFVFAAMRVKSVRRRDRLEGVQGVAAVLHPLARDRPPHDHGRRPR